jgi:predicted metal-binding membrane protein
MSAISSLAPSGGKFLFSAGKMRTLLRMHPEWWAWFLSIVVWGLLVMDLFPAPHNAGRPGTITYCTPAGIVSVPGHSPFEAHSILKEDPFSSRILTTVSDGLLPWIFMVAAMMFPLLNEPIRHVTFSIRRKDRFFGIFWFLTGYAITWTIGGALFRLLALFLDIIAGDKSQLLRSLIIASGFLLAAALTWHPGRPVKMSKCGQTMPIRINGWHLLLDSLFYGLRMGYACLNMCWAPMAALMLVHHNIVLMLAVTVAIIYERYLLPHTSKLPGYVWGVIAFTLFSIEMWA